MTTKTTSHLGRRPIHPISQFMQQRDPLALIAALACLGVLILIVFVTIWRGVTAAPAGGRPALAPALPILVFATAAPTQAPTATAADPELAALKATVQAQAEQLAQLQAQLASQPAPAAAQQPAPVAAESAPAAAQQAQPAETTYYTSSAPAAAPPAADPASGPSDWTPHGRASDAEIAQKRQAWLAAGQASIDAQAGQPGGQPPITLDQMPCHCP